MKQGDTITINKPGSLVHGIKTEIVSIADTGDRPIKVCVPVEWFLSFKEAGGEDKPDNLEYIPTKPKAESVTPIAEIKVKRPYVKRVDKPKGVKTKRKYTKKNNQL